MRTSDSGGVVSGRCVIMSLVDERRKKAYVNCKEKERDKKEERKSTHEREKTRY